MIYNYYPGCTLSTKAKKLDMAARRAADALGFPLVELPEWQCCGAVYPMAPDAIAERLSAVRALAAAKANGGVLVTLCSACHHVLKRVNHDMATKPEYEANIVAAEILLDTDELLEYVYEYGYTSEQIARAMHTDINLVALKIAHLAETGYDLRRIEHRSDFLK